MFVDVAEWGGGEEVGSGEIWWEKTRWEREVNSTSPPPTLRKRLAFWV